ncbi:MAG: hypothetical protein VB878_10990 [Pirellulaceae bacterium]
MTLDIQPCGYLQVQMRNFVRSSTDVAAEIDTMEMVHRSEQGQLVMTTGPLLEVTVHIRVQCANWFDINRVQILLNGKLDDRYNYTRREHGERFGLGVVKFDRKIELEVTQDTHIVVATTGEGCNWAQLWGRTAESRCLSPRAIQSLWTATGRDLGQTVTGWVSTYRWLANNLEERRQRMGR